MSEVLSLRVDEETLRLLQERAERDGVSRSEVARAAVWYFVNAEARGDLDEEPAGQ